MRGLWARWARCAVAVALLSSAPAMATNGPAQAAQVAAIPQVVPALQQWTAGTGSYSFTATSRVVTDSAYAGQLAGTASVFATDLGALHGRTVATLVGGPADVNTGDIFLTLGSTDTALGPQGYRMSVGASLTIQARADAGAFNGTRTVLQLLSRSTTVPGGTARDWPVTRQRGLMVDNGRKYYSLIWLRNHVRQLAYLKYNVLHLHISDDQGFRLESSVHPEVVSPQHYTKAQIADLVAFAARYHITVVPEIDMPSHMTAVLASHPELRLVSSTGAVSAGKLDLSKAAARQLAADLVTEYLPLFPGAVWHMGADEYLSASQYASYPQLLAYAQATYGAGATGPDAFLGFVNWVDGIVRAQGKTLRIWNDGVFGGRNVTLSPGIQIDYWQANGVSPAQFTAAGHQLMNSNSSYLYYVLGKSWKPDPARIYNSFLANLFQDGSTVPVSDPKLLGTSLSIWADLPNSESEVRVGAAVLPSLQALAQVMWGSPKPAADYTGFQAVTTAVGQPPGREGSPPPTPMTSLPTYSTYLPSNMVDGTTSTFFWGNGVPVVGDYIGVDLGTARPISGVEILMGKSDRPNDYLHNAVLEHSRDAVTWTSLGTFTTAAVRATPPSGTTARYVRLRSTASQTYWLVATELTVTVRPSATASTNLPIYSTYPPGLMVDGNTTTWFWSNGAPPVGGYVRVDLGTARPISIVDVLMANGNSPNDFIHRGVLESSLDGTAWTVLASFAGHNEVTVAPPAGTTARYLRVRSTASQTYWLVVDEFLVG
ncbi:MAG TPA: family 20 glycosylhydrolase [Micromonosporaceae bacterium]|nr:family 20 glycosylhydrolase [Micromonosporaceae bacterium]